jgi:hypothetical protein
LTKLLRKQVLSPPPLLLLEWTVDISGATQLNFKDDTTTCKKKPVAFVGRRGKKSKVSKAPGKVVQVKEAAAVEAVDLEHHVEKIEAVKTVKPLPPPDFKAVETVEALESKPPPPDLKPHVEVVEVIKAVETVEVLGSKPPCPDLKPHVEVPDKTDSSLLDLLPDDDVSVEFSRVAAIQKPTKDPVLLLYPFVGGKALENAATGLVFGDEVVHYSEPCLLQIRKKNTHPKARFMTVRKKDIDSLQPGNLVKNVIIDFLSMCLIRKEDQKDSVVLPMTTYFYTTLTSVGGIQQVLGWTQNWIFSKCFIFVPVNEALHWLLCLVINPGLVTVFNDDEVDVEVPCMIFLDSLKCHSTKKVAQNMRTWLNAEWNRKYGVNETLFTP